jgi:hypothetical protein
VQPRSAAGHGQPTGYIAENINISGIFNNNPGKYGVEREKTL